MNHPLKYDLDQEFDLCLIPNRPGVYIFLDKDSRAIYIGKAKNLRSRLASYLRKGAAHSAKTALMLKRACYLDVVITATEKDALILEAELIGEHKPKYNIRLRDDKAYPFLRIGTGSTFPRISMVRKRQSDGAIYFGPYTSSLELKRTISLISSLFRLRTCTDSYMKNRTRPCLKYQVGKCSAPCMGKITRQAYEKDIRRLKYFLNGHTANVVSSLKREMDKAAMALDFERAAMLRDSIKAIESLLDSQNVISRMDLELDVIYVEIGDGMGQAAVLKVREGVLRQKQAFSLDVGIEDSIEQVYTRFITLYYSNAQIPREVVVPDLFSSELLEGLSSYLSRLGAKKKVIVRQAKSGIRKRLIHTAKLNAGNRLGEELLKKEQWNDLALGLKKHFGLRRIPQQIEGIDISNTSGKDPVGSLVCFVSGEPVKASYRQYKIRSAGPNDYEMIGEVIKRRLKSGFKNGNLPDLIIVDGGKGHLSTAVKAARDLGIFDKIDFISIAKEHRQEGEKIYVTKAKEPIFLARDNPVLRFCQRVRDEAHRFGVRLHRKRRDRRILSSPLVEIPGVGPKRRALLLRYFGSLEALINATQEELEKVPGLPKDVALALYNKFKDEG